VSSVGEFGLSEYVLSGPVWLRGVPGAVVSASVKSLNASFALLEFLDTVQTNGASIRHFIVEWSGTQNGSTSSAESSREVVTPNHRVQIIYDNIYLRPFNASALFSLTLSDFGGSFVRRLGDFDQNSLPTYISIVKGSNLLVKVPSNSSIGVGSASLYTSVVPGEFIRIGEVVFRACLNMNSSEVGSYSSHQVPLCTVENAYTPATYKSSTMTMAPAFLLDTSIGSAWNTGFGDSHLNTFFGPFPNLTVNDLTLHLQRGDFLRLGDPQAGTTVRVSTDMGRPFTSSSVPLGRVDNPQKPYYIQTGDIINATWEIQEIIIAAQTLSSHATAIYGGFRAQFGYQTTSETIAGGQTGCLAWGATSDELKNEIEALQGIDSVVVTREHATNASGKNVSVRYSYFVTFSGSSVAGNVPQLYFVDIGANGCDAFNALASTLARTVQTSFVPLYKKQTTVDIPYSATEWDMKAALESLSGVCSVAVSRRILDNGFIWTVTFPGGNPMSLLSALRGNDHLLNGVLVKPNLEIQSLTQLVLPVKLRMMPYELSLTPVNEVGAGPTTKILFSTEGGMAVPLPPEFLLVDTISDSEFLAQWAPSSLETAKPTNYLLEWTSQETFLVNTLGSGFGSSFVDANTLSPIFDVQAIQLSVSPGYFFSGFFHVQYDEQLTNNLDYDISANQLAYELSLLCNMPPVSVSRNIGPGGGFSWMITFMEAGNQFQRFTSPFQTVRSHKLTVHGDNLLVCTDQFRENCRNSPTQALISTGSIQEVQSLHCHTQIPFSIVFRGSVSVPLGPTSTALEITSALQLLPSIGLITVALSGGNRLNCSGDLITVVFDT